jgi:hypothetical protein
MTESLTAMATRYIRNPDDFARKLEGPFLLFEPRAPSLDDSGEMYRFKTISSAGPVTISSGEPVVFTIQKTKDNAFQRGVTVGRTTNNDLVLDDPSVSRFHAWFQLDDDRWFVVDAVSKNGTYLQGQPLKPKQPTPIAEEAKIRFGTVEVTYLTANGLLQLLRSRLRT